MYLFDWVLFDWVFISVFIYFDTYLFRIYVMFYFFFLDLLGPGFSIRPCTILFLGRSTCKWIPSYLRGESLGSGTYFLTGSGEIVPLHISGQSASNGTEIIACTI